LVILLSGAEVLNQRWSHRETARKTLALTRIGAWSDAEIKRAIARPLREGRKLEPPIGYPV
jgi:hypothetical protein